MDDPIVAPEQVKPVVRRRWLRGAAWTVLVLLVGLGWWIGPVIRDFFKAGFFDKTKMRSYEGASIDNLRAMHMAMMQYHDSEEMFPDSSAWMDAIENRIQVFDMEKAESMKKLIAPLYRDQPGKYGYAMNDLCSRKYKDDLPDPSKTVLIFESSDTSRNAHGDPANLMAAPAGGSKALAISVEGQLIGP